MAQDSMYLSDTPNDIDKRKVKITKLFYKLIADGESGLIKTFVNCWGDYIDIHDVPADTGDNLLHLALAQDVETLAIVASLFPDLIEKPNFQGIKPLERVYISSEWQEKLYYLLYYYPGSDIDLGSLIMEGEALQKFLCTVDFVLHYTDKKITWVTYNEEWNLHWHCKQNPEDGLQVVLGEIPDTGV